MHAPAKPIQTVCVFSSSSDALAPAYYDAASDLGSLLGERRYTLVFGGGTIGLMGAVARACHEHGGRVIGVIPRRLNREGITYRASDELIVTDNLRIRKTEMDKRADAFVALPGGFGTLEEIAEHLALRQLRYHPKPVVLINTLGIYDPLLSFFERLMTENFMKREHYSLFHVAATPHDALAYLDGYQAPEVVSKFY